MTNTGNTLEARVRIIEEALNQVPFLGYRLGATLNDVLEGQILCQWYKLGPLNILKSIIRIVIAFLRPPLHGNALANSKGRIWLTSLGDRSHLTGLLYPLLRKFRSEELVVLCTSKVVENKLQADSISHESLLLLARDYPRWRWIREIVVVFPSWLITLTLALAKAKISFGYAPMILQYLVSSSQRVLAYERLVRRAAPQFILTEADRNELASCLILAARRMNVPTATMVHGAMGPYPEFGFFPILSDYIFCWGDRQKSLSKSFGLSERQIKVPGYQAIDTSHFVARDNARSIMGISAHKKVVTFATTPFGALHRRRLVEVFVKAFGSDPNVEPIIRLHPGDLHSLYSDLVAPYPNVRITAASELNLDTVLGASDMLVCHNTSCGSDALLRGVPVVVLDVIEIPLVLARNYVTDAGCPRVSNESELQFVAQEILGRPLGPDRIGKAAQLFLSSNYAKYGDEAAVNIRYEIENILGDIKNCAGK